MSRPRRPSASPAAPRMARRSSSPPRRGSRPSARFSRDGEVGQQAELLVDGGDAEAQGACAGRAMATGRAVEADGAGVGCEHARQDVDQRRLAGAVLADEAVRPRPAASVERHVVERHARRGSACRARSSASAGRAGDGLRRWADRRSSRIGEGSRAGGRGEGPQRLSRWRRCRPAASRTGRSAMSPTWSAASFSAASTLSLGDQHALDQHFLAVVRLGGDEEGEVGLPEAGILRGQQHGALHRRRP